MEQVVGDRQLLLELLAIFKTSFAEDMAAIRYGLSGDDISKAVSAAHSIKGASASIGLDGITEAARKLEDEGKAGHLTEARRCLRQLETMLRELEAL